jgi:hypothetical protein
LCWISDFTPATNQLFHLLASVVGKVLFQNIPVFNRQLGFPAGVPHERILPSSCSLPPNGINPNNLSQ